MVVQCNCGFTGGCQLCLPTFQPTIHINEGFVTPKGWECPKCERIYAPACMECFNCNSKKANGLG